MTGLRIYGPKLRGFLQLRPCGYRPAVGSKRRSPDCAESDPLPRRSRLRPPSLPASSKGNLLPWILMPPNRKRRATAMEPAAVDAGKQRQNKASAGKKGKKGGGSAGTGGRWPAVKPKKDLQINRLKGTHLLTVPDFFTSAEAKAFIDIAESMGFSHQGSLGPLKGEAYRDNDRISVSDPLLAQTIWESGINRIFADINVSGKVATGLNPNIRFYRYTEGQRFGRHIDGSVNLGDGSRTYYTLLIYLSGKGGAKDSSGQALVGGETVFYDNRGGIVAEVAPVQGTALLHLHGEKCMLHEARVVKKNTKYILRSDVVFS